MLAKTIVATLGLVALSGATPLPRKQAAGCAPQVDMNTAYNIFYAQG